MVIQLPPRIFHYSPSSLHRTVVVIQRRQRLVGGNVFRCLDVQSLRGNQCLPTPGRQTPASPLDPSRPGRACRARNRTCSSKSSRQWRCNFPRGKIPTQSRADYDCACGRLWFWKQRGSITCQLKTKISRRRLISWGNSYLGGFYIFIYWNVLNTRIPN